MPRGIPNQEKKHRRRRRRKMQEPQQQQLQQEQPQQQMPIEVSHEQLSPIIERLLGRITGEGTSISEKFTVLRENIESLSKWFLAWPSDSRLRAHAEEELIDHLHALRALRETAFGVAHPVSVTVPAPAPETQPSTVC